MIGLPNRRTTEERERQAPHDCFEIIYLLAPSCLISAFATTYSVISLKGTQIPLEAAVPRSRATRVRCASLPGRHSRPRLPCQRTPGYIPIAYHQARGVAYVTMHDIGH